MIYFFFHCTPFLSYIIFCKNQQGAPTLIIGNHELKGTSIKLKEPFAVLRKRKASQVSEDDDVAKKILNSESGVQLEVVGVVKKKLMVR